MEWLRTFRLGRGAYAGWGLLLVFAKYNIDRIAAARFGRGPFFPWSYFIPGGGESLLEIAPDERTYFLTLALGAIPFAIVGVLLTVFRLRSAGWPVWLVILFFLPVINLIFFAVLCWVPPADRPRADETAGLCGWLRWILPRRPVATAAVAIVTTAAMTALLVWRQRLWPQAYWAGFSDYLIHAIHRRVLEHIRTEVETAAW